MSHGDLKDFFGVEILEHRMDKYAKNEQRRLLWWKNEARRQEQRGAENFSAIEIAPKISQITGLYCSKIRTFTQRPGARWPSPSTLKLFVRSFKRRWSPWWWWCPPCWGSRATWRWLLLQGFQRSVADRWRNSTGLITDEKNPEKFNQNELWKPNWPRWNYENIKLWLSGLQHGKAGLQGRCHVHDPG